MEYNEDDYLMLSGIQHFVFCRRQWALIHIEQHWQENEHTVIGELFHKRAHDAYFHEKRNDLIVSRGMPVHSRTMGVSGICDIVEFYKDEDGISLHAHRGQYRVYPVEYKKGHPKETRADQLQLVAQAMCLEEMMCCKIDEGAIFYGETRRRDRLAITEELREEVIKAFKEMHELFNRGYTPKVKWSKSCNACSLKDLCVPKLGRSPSAKEYIKNAIAEEDI